MSASMRGGRYASLNQRRASSATTSSSGSRNSKVVIIGLVLLVLSAALAVGLTVGLLAPKSTSHIATVVDLPSNLAIESFSLFTQEFLLRTTNLWTHVFLFDSTGEPVQGISVVNATILDTLTVTDTAGDVFQFFALEVSPDSPFYPLVVFEVNVTLAGGGAGRRLLSASGEALGNLTVTVQFEYDLTDYTSALYVNESQGTIWPSRTACAIYCTGGATNCHNRSDPLIADVRVVDDGYWVCWYGNDSLSACQLNCTTPCNTEDDTCNFVPPTNATGCRQTLQGDLTCDCPLGLAWQAHSHECVDVNECLLGGSGDNDHDDDDSMGICNIVRGPGYTCFNTIGSFECIPCRSAALQNMSLTDPFFLDPRCPSLVAFVLPVSSGRLGDLAGAALQCQAEAARNGLVGFFVPALSSSVWDLTELMSVYPDFLPYVTPDGRLLAYDITGFRPAIRATHPELNVTGKLFANDFNMMANGSVANDTANYWPVLLSGDDPFGLVFANPYLETFDDTCADWTSASPDLKTIAGFMSNFSAICDGDGLDDDADYDFCWFRRAIIPCGGDGEFNQSQFIPAAARDLPLQRFIACVSMFPDCQAGTEAVEETFQVGNVLYNRTVCVPIGECSIPENNAICQRAGLACQDRPGLGFTCKCHHPHWQEFDFGTGTCVALDRCQGDALDPCYFFQECEGDLYDSCPYFSNCHDFRNGTLSCGSCLSGFEGPDCEDVNECNSPEVNCSLDDGYVCTNFAGGYSCDPCFEPALSNLNITGNLAAVCQAQASQLFLLPFDLPFMQVDWAEGMPAEYACNWMAQSHGIMRDHRTYIPYFIVNQAWIYNLSLDTTLILPNGSLVSRSLEEFSNAGGVYVNSLAIMDDGQPDNQTSSEVFLAVTGLNSEASQDHSGENCTNALNIAIFGVFSEFVVGAADHWDLLTLESSVPWANVDQVGCLGPYAPDLPTLANLTVRYGVYCVEQAPPPALSWSEVFMFVHEDV